MDMEPPELDKPTSPEPAPKFHWLLFLGVIFVPTILTVLSATGGGKDAPPALAMIGGGLSGLAGGILLARRVGSKPETRLYLGLLFVPLLSVACVTMNCIGCLAGGFKLNIH